MMAYTVLPLAGETASPIFPISSVGRPLVSLLHVAPASTDFQIASPVPTHTTSGFFGSTATVPIEYDACASNTGVQVVPAFTVFQTPAEWTATYQVLLSRGWIATSPIRPDGAAGPRFRSRSPANSP